MINFIATTEYATGQSTHNIVAVAREGDHGGLSKALVDRGMPLLGAALELIIPDLEHLPTDTLFTILWDDGDSYTTTLGKALEEVS